ncbi:MAG: exodeoxyribonuclease VII large subunit, partial [Spirochaetaceae bacterium]|nr:exodeoxyribonuclease VII large subunit [Spirochaetaceae bacterium]
MYKASVSPLWSVSELTSAIKYCLEDEFPSVRVQGEISNCRPSGAGHVYFTLKDSGSVISAVLFRGRAAGSALRPEDGISVVASGKIDVYPPRGSYQLIVDSMEPAGKGALLEALELRKRALAAEGLFDMDRKKSLPPYPRRVAVVTSPTGAAVRDILQVLSRRAAAPRVTILPTPVQGNDAPGKIADQLARASSYSMGDVVILARGGGSIEDLMCFNDEIVVRAVAACSLPVVSGVGHEIDVTLADLAADVRAATPSAAAELVSDRSEDLLIRARGVRRDAAGLL